MRETINALTYKIVTYLLQISHNKYSIKGVLVMKKVLALAKTFVTTVLAELTVFAITE